MVDAVVVASPNMTHATVLRDVLASPLPVLVEKPLCTAVADCRTMVEAAAHRDAIVWSGSSIDTCRRSRASSARSAPAQSADPHGGDPRGLLAVAVGVAAHRSIDEGRVVAMAEVLAS